MAAMEETRFWSLIEQARFNIGEDAADPQLDLVDALQELLEDLPPEEIAAFQEQMRQVSWRAYTYPLAAAVYVIRGDNVDPDDFRGFRGWLISRGQAEFQRAVADPDSLADDDLVPAEVYLPDILDIGAIAYEETTGEEWEPDPTQTEPEEPSGEPLLIQDIPRRLPRLCDDFVFTFDEEEVEALAEAQAEAAAAPPPAPEKPR